MANLGHNNRYHVLILEGYCKQCLPFIREFKRLGCEVTVLCGSKWDCSYVSRLPDHRVVGICDLQNPDETEIYIVNMIKQGQYNLVVPMFDMSAKILANHYEELKGYASLCVNNKNVFAVASDKKEVMNICNKNGIPHPRTAFKIGTINELDEMDVKFPVIIKPRSSYGARGFKIFNSIKQFHKYIEDSSIELSSVVIQEQIPEGSDLVTCVMYIDKKGVVKSCYVYCSEHFFPIEGGSSTLNGLVDKPEIVNRCKFLAELLKLRGLIGVDLMIDRRDNIPKVLEINARCVHGITLGFIAGVNHAQQMLEDALGYEVTEMNPGRADIACRILQTDVLWWLKSPKRYIKTPKKLGYKHVKEQMFYWDDPLPWFSFLLGGIKDFKKKMYEKKGEYAA